MVERMINTKAGEVKTDGSTVNTETTNIEGIIPQMTKDDYLMTAAILSRVLLKNIFNSIGIPVHNTGRIYDLGLRRYSLVVNSAGETHVPDVYLNEAKIGHVLIGYGIQGSSIVFNHDAAS